MLVEKAKGLDALGLRASAWANHAAPWSWTIGCARSLLALCTAATLAVNGADVLFAPTLDVPTGLACDGVRSAGLFCVATHEHLDVARWVAVLALLVVASGYRPRVTGIVHGWISFSLHNNATVGNGGDQIAAALTLLLLPLTLTDPRRWHWEAPPPSRGTTGDTVTRLVARSSVWAVRVQVAIIYFHAAAGKLSVQEWVDGTVLYYWFTDPHVGAAPWLMPVVRWFVNHGTLLALTTWSVLVIEFLLAAALVMDRRYWPPVFALGLFLHAGILAVHGLFTFALTMMAALVLYLPPERAAARRLYSSLALRNRWTT
ncbi:sporulation-delaying protein SdpB family protein [Polyangium sp. y55x31]|uniref:sporulation-delaying protein SdpB family protein n=1 Tax=Polyangium sp. y55x31 TaxID=3042688 RepID=UPI002482E395|nr:sporulation-delaying protein SdpB family protein [Polyangium sp. y55x31]MDI1477561.1 hypothetical protein [Polyangium sp. y55x31]